jgi:hypothetical protein
MSPDPHVESSAAEGRLQVRLDVPLPREVGMGRGTALFICGTCFDSEQPIESLAFVVDGTQQPVLAHGMPRLDLLRALHPGLDPYETSGVAVDPASEEDPMLHSYRSGFWGVARIEPTHEPVPVGLRARLRHGGVETVDLALLSPTSLPEPVERGGSDPAGGPLVAICMTTYEPPLDLFRRQVQSIRSQSHRNWICVISDDCSSARSFEAIQRELEGDPRFVLTRSPRRLGFYLNFERALALAPAEAQYVALSDQDDFWYPDKLRTLLAEIGDAQLVYSDARVVDGHGDVISNTYWSRRRNNHDDLLSLLVANSVTGAASLFRRELLDYVLPFPPPQFAHFHDHWIALTALAIGTIAFVDRPLYDYVQHGDATLGHAAANRMPALRDRLGSLRGDPRERVRMWRLHYFVDVARLTQCATILQMRCGARMGENRRAELEQFLDADRSLRALGALWGRGLRELIGPPETLGAEWMLAYAFTWRRLLSASARRRPARRLRLDALPPPALVMAPGRSAPGNAATLMIAEKVAPLALSVSDRAPERINLLIPTIDLAHFFGGYIGKFNLAKRLAERGARVRIVTVDPVGPLPRHWKSTIESYSGLAGVFDRVEVAFGRETPELDASRSDAFIATTWWTAHIAHRALTSVSRERFLYLIQEYEPFTFPMGTYAALAAESYRFPHRALFSTELLRDYFRRNAIGVYSDGPGPGDANSASFQNAITAIESPSATELERRDSRRLLFYARPELHASRNLFELGVLALTQACRDGALGDGWELHGIGAIEGRQSLDLGAGARLMLLPRSDQGSYAKLLRQHDLGLALMYTPHPSLVPIEMASAGMVTVTNSFENKTQAAMTAISTNLLAPPPTIGAVADALGQAAARVEQYEQRARGSHVAWSTDWDESFADGVIERVLALLER